MNNNLAYKNQTIENKDKRVIIYCRESRDDNGTNYERIETQRDLLLKYCERNGYTNIIEIIMHDNMSGTDFSRLDDLKEKIMNGHVDCVCMKDSSRMGRNQLEALKFTAIIEEYGVELIFESEQYDEYFSLKCWFNEIRAKDDSKKIRTNLRHKMEEGKLLIKAHYGYIKIEKSLIIDDNTAWVIRKIFDMYINGYNDRYNLGFRAIATILNDENIPTPSETRNDKNTNKTKYWIAQHISRIISNEAYIGILVSGTTTKVSYKSKKTHRTTEDKWVRTEGHHEAIIDKEVFKLAQQIRNKKKDFAPKSKEKNLFAGFLFCGRCNKNLIADKRKNRPLGYVCLKYHNEGKFKNDDVNRGCSTHHIKESDVNEIFKNHIKNVLNNELYRQAIYKNLKNVEFVKNNYRNTLKRLEELLNKYQSQYKEIYQDKLDKKIPEFIYIDKTKEIEKNINITEKQMEELKKEFNQYQEIETNVDKIDKMFEKIIEDGYSRKDLMMILNKIVIYDENEISEFDKEQYNIDDETYQEVLMNGGIVIVFKHNIPHVFTNRWVRYLTDTSKEEEFYQFLKSIA